MESSAATRYDELWESAYGDMQDIGPVHRHMRRIVAKVLQPLSYRSVVDVGCGAGHNMPLLVGGRDLDRVTGADVSEEALGRARERMPAADFVPLDVERDGLDGTWDLVFSSLLIEHLNDDEAALRNMRAMAGRDLVLTTIAGDFERYRAWDEQVGHVRNYARGELEAKLAAAGFTVQQAVYWGFPFYTPLVRTLQNRSRPTAEYTRGARIASAVMHRVFFLNSHRRGDLLVVHATAA
jgi:SAM-dependent methyltransferase